MERLHELVSLPKKKIEDTQECQQLYTRLAMYLNIIMYNNNVFMYLNILSDPINCLTTLSFPRSLIMHLA